MDEEKVSESENEEIVQIIEEDEEMELRMKKE